MLTVALNLSACGGSSDIPAQLDPLVAATDACVHPGDNAYCYADAGGCCPGTWCDDLTRFCRIDGECGVNSQSCDAEHPCCDGYLCTPQGCFSGTAVE